MAQGTVILLIESDSNNNKTAKFYSNFKKLCDTENLPYSKLHNCLLPLKYKNLVIDRITINSTNKITL
jgi:hypothetical protein